MVLIYVSLQKDAQASDVAELLLKSRLANHINIIHNIECMVYENDQITRSSETILLIKTKALLYKQIEEKLLNLQLQPAPKIFSAPMTQIEADYHDYLLKDTIKV
ncbi:periplasmic divalent cation tolerance protein CutA [Flammeovirgaceae bacterium 311]|nr:periplasmic divalent cation tolerance protein CutA [Flammeovirgaceae bacterium 311]